MKFERFFMCSPIALPRLTRQQLCAWRHFDNRLAACDVAQVHHGWGAEVPKERHQKRYYG
jgi:hypothetical protein